MQGPSSFPYSVCGHIQREVGPDERLDIQCLGDGMYGRYLIIYMPDDEHPNVLTLCEVEINYVQGALSHFICKFWHYVN